MSEVLQIILSSFWSWAGTMALLYVAGHALASPFFWIYQLKRLKRKQQGWRPLDN